MSEIDAPTVEDVKPTPKSITTLARNGFHLCGVLAFWGWNIIGVMMVVFLILPYLFIPLIAAFFSGIVPVSIFIFILALMALPFISMWIAGAKRMSIPALMFGVEVPLFILIMMRMFLMREMTFASGFLVGSGILAVGLFAWGHWRRGGATDLPVLKSTLYRRLSPLVLIAGVFVGVLSLLYAVPLLAHFVMLIFEFFTFQWLNSFFWGEGVIFAFIVVAFFFATLFVFIVFPIYISAYYPALWRSVGKGSSKVMTKPNFVGYTLGFALVWIGIHGLSSLQPRANYVAELEAMTPAERVALIQKPGTTQERLLHAYLNEYRYLGRAEAANNLDVTYRQTFGSNLGHVPQTIQNYLLAPLLYKGGQNDKRGAGELYQEIFDVSIQRDYKDEIAKALKTTYNRDDIEAGLMNIGARNVALTEQNITLDDKGDHGVILIEEVYKNLTSENQEIFYYFSLPLDAALTGVWIGQTPDRDKMDAYIVAPRGAAQEVYERSVQRQIDPALLEQVGPRQYRLRVFPIPVERGWRAENRTTFEPMRLQMEVTVPRSETGYVLPKLLEKRNVDWNWRTKRTVDGKRIKRSKGWMSSQVDSELSSELNAFSIDTVAGYSVVGTPQIDPPRTQGLSFAVLVDTSYSIRDVDDQLIDAVKSLSDWAKANTHSVDYFLSFASGQDPARYAALNPETVTPFGRVTPVQQITDFNLLAQDVTYDAVLILTDQGTYGAPVPGIDVTLNAPLWFIHLGLSAFAYDDHILDLIYRSGGGIAEGVADFERRIGFAGSHSIVGESYVWRVRPDDSSETTKSPLSSLAAKQIIAQAARGQSPTPEALDGLHDIAKAHSVVTPYSSMIVLVNERQKQALKEAAEREDRFERESKLGEETLQSPNQPLVSAVPEPHEWLLIILSLILLGYAYRHRERWDVVC